MTVNFAGIGRRAAVFNGNLAAGIALLAPHAAAGALLSTYVAWFWRLGRSSRPR
jgi:hypothetical protein